MYYISFENWVVVKVKGATLQLVTAQLTQADVPLLITLGAVSFGQVDTQMPFDE
jgi:hypothetical protein